MAKVRKKVVVGLSGGIDSSMALFLLKKEGFETIGVSLKLPVWKSCFNLLRENICCTKESLENAKKLCQKLNSPYFVLDTEKEFEETVIKYFKKKLKEGKTPNPCVVCNQKFKFKKLLEFAKKVKADFVATGHYAKVEFDQKTKEFQLKRAKDKIKDQTYFLSFLKRSWLKNIIFPLGDWKKKEIKKLAQKEGFSFLLERRQSQDFCFVAQKSFYFFLKEEIGKKPGKIIDEKGNVLGEHEGIHFFTIGQRKGLKLPGGPFYVFDLDKKRNIVFVTKNKEKLYKKEIYLYPYNFLIKKPNQKKLKVLAKIRFRQPLSQAWLHFQEKYLKIIFKKPQFAPTPGQFCVFYKNDVCLGGGEIAESK